MNLRASCIAVVLATAPGVAGAANMQVSPVWVEIGPAAPSAVITVRNGGSTPARYQLSAMSWTEPRAGAARLEPSSELSFFPPLFQLGAGEERKVRIGATVPPGATERAWRLFVEEIPAAVEAPPTAGQIRIRTRFGVPVFQAPLAPRATGEVALAFVAGTLSATVRSTGNAHVRPDKVEVALLDGKGGTLRVVQVESGVVLAGAERTNDVAVPAEVCEAVRTATIAAELPGGQTLRSALPLAAGACAR